jgi:hypothetical protein
MVDEAEVLAQTVRNLWELPEDDRHDEILQALSVASHVDVSVRAIQRASEWLPEDVAWFLAALEITSIETDAVIFGTAPPELQRVYSDLEAILSEHDLDETAAASTPRWDELNRLHDTLSQEFGARLMHGYGEPHMANAYLHDPDEWDARYDRGRRLLYESVGPTNPT